METGNASANPVIAETKLSVPRDSDSERIAQLKEVEKRQSAMNTSDVGSADIREAM